MNEGKLEAGVYRGQAGYASQFNLTESDLRKKQTAGTLGKIRAQGFSKAITRIDHNPERCKDFYEHGYCAYGDTCKYIHDRSDYKSGAQLERDWEKAQMKKKRQLQGADATDSESDYEIHSDASKDSAFVDGVPVYCRLCAEFFSDPVQLECLHIFCDSCALRYYHMAKECYVCDKKSNGVFNNAPKEVVDKIAELKLKVGQEGN